MNYSAVLFDLDGTLLPMDQDAFTKAYFSLLAKKLAPHGYDPEKLVAAIWQGTKAMVKNTGEKTNEQVFWDAFAAIFGEKVRGDLPLFDDYYLHEFDGVQLSCGFHEKAAQVVAYLKEKGVPMALATNPIFPKEATEKRIKWAGLNKEDFLLVTTYEDSRHCKPNPDYYRDIVEKLHLNPVSCLMVGNDALEDTAAETLGMQVFLLTDCLINKTDKDISQYPRGNFDDLMAFLQA